MIVQIDDYQNECIKELTNENLEKKEIMKTANEKKFENELFEINCISLFIQSS